MLRKIITVVVIIIALIILFLLGRTVVNSFRDDPQPKSTAQTEATITEPVETEPNVTTETNNESATADPSTPASNATPDANTPSAAATTTTNNGDLANTGPGEIAAITIAATAAIGTTLLIRRRQLAQL